MGAGRIEVHSDAQGNSAYNQILTEKLIPVGFGETKPVAPNTTAEGRTQNRRTLFVNAALNGKPIGGLSVDGGGRIAGDACRC